MADVKGVIHDVRQAVQDIVAPGVQELKGEIKGLDAKFSARLDGLDVKINSLRSELKTDINSLRSEMKSGNTAIMSALETAILRGENSTLRDLSNLRERVTRLEDQISRKQ